MSSGDGETAAARLAREFDQTFAAPVGAGIERAEAVIALRAAGAPYAVRLAEMTGLIADRPVVPLPTPVPELLGLTGVRGGLVPVYGLAELLGGGDGREARAGEGPRWLLMTGGDTPLALAFDELEGHVEVARADILPAQAGQARAHVTRSVRLADGVRPLVDLLSVLETVKRRVGPGGRGKES